MSCFRGDFYSEQLRMHTSIQVFVPDGKPNSEWPVLYLLHGLSDNCSNWMQNTRLGRYAAKYGVAVVMPEGERGWYTDMAHGLRYFSYVSDELFHYVHRMFGLSNRREKSFIAGLSMGGYGALKCALARPGRYAGCASFSGACDVVGRFVPEKVEPEYLDELRGVYGRDLKIRPQDDLFHLAEKAARRAVKPAVYLTCGLQDERLHESRKFRDHLDALGFAPRYEEWDGFHDWDFWEESLRRTFALFFGEN